MPIGEFVMDVILRMVLEFVFLGLSYASGFVVLKCLSLGRIRLAGLDTIRDKNRTKDGRWDWSLWLNRPLHGRNLKAECTCAVGVLTWVAGVLIYAFG